MTGAIEELHVYSRVMRFEPIEVEEYGVTPTQFENVQNRILSWAFALRARIDAVERRGRMRHGA